MTSCWSGKFVRMMVTENLVQQEQEAKLSWSSCDGFPGPLLRVRFLPPLPTFVVLFFCCCGCSLFSS